MPGQDNSVCEATASEARFPSPLPACGERPTRKARRVRGSLRESRCYRLCGDSPSPHPLPASGARGSWQLASLTKRGNHRRPS
nr:hypothetical protein FNV92_18530 [Bradyrhizobium cosmicum]